MIPLPILPHPAPRERRVVARHRIEDAPTYGGHVDAGAIGVCLDVLRIDRLVVCDFGGRIVVCDPDEIAEYNGA